MSTVSAGIIRGGTKASPSGRAMPMVAIGKQLRLCPGVLTLGVRQTFEEYEPWEKELLLSGWKIYFPTRRFIDIFLSKGIQTYPNWRDYRYIGDKFGQTLLFQALGIPHPRTRFYRGVRQAKQIVQDFSFPFIAKIGRNSSKGKGVFLICNQADLDAYCQTNRHAYIQEYLPINKSVRVVLLNGHVIYAYWRKAPSGSHLTNIYQGGTISKDPVSEEILVLARMVAVKCKFDEVGLDIIQKGDTCYVIEANMAFGRRGLEEAGLDLNRIRYQMLEKGLI